MRSAEGGDLLDEGGMVGALLVQKSALLTNRRGRMGLTGILEEKRMVQVDNGPSRLIHGMFSSSAEAAVFERLRRSVERSREAISLRLRPILGPR